MFSYMVLTRSMSSTETFTKLIDEKLKDLRVSLLQEYKNAIDTYFEEKKNEFTAFVTANNAVSTSNELSESIKLIQSHVTQLKAENMALKSKVDDLQQYVRRPNLRFFGVPLPAKETADDVKRTVVQIIEENGIDVPTSSIDRAHRIGKISTNERNQKIQPIIVRFTTFRDRTLVYRGRKEVRKKVNIGISLDLTSDRYILLKQAREMVQNVSGINFAYSDINCQLRVLTKDGKHLPFNSTTDLVAIISSCET